MIEMSVVDLSFDELRLTDWVDVGQTQLALEGHRVFDVLAGVHVGLLCFDFRSLGNDFLPEGKRQAVLVDLGLPLLILASGEVLVGDCRGERYARCCQTRQPVESGFSWHRWSRPGPP